MIQGWFQPRDEIYFTWIKGPLVIHSKAQNRHTTDVLNRHCMGALPPPKTPSMSARFGEEEGRGRRELALNLPDDGEVVVSDAGEFLSPEP